MRVFSVPLSVPFLRSVIAALVDGRLVEGFEARKNPERLAQATLYLPTRRAGRMAREIFLDELNSDAAVLPRIVALGDIDEDELAFAQAATPGMAALEIPPATLFAFQILLGVVFGVWGLTLALPMLAIAKVIIDFVRNDEGKPVGVQAAAS